MGRQPKQGLDYFPFDVTLLDDPKLRRPRQEFGYLAEIIYISLLCILYKDKGYYIEYHGDKRDDVIWQVNEKISGRYPTTIETIANVIDRLAACELFSGELFEQGIITSKRAQAVFYTATTGRTAVDVDFGLWLLSRSEMEAASTKSIVLRNFISHAINANYGAGNVIYHAESTQSREQESREQKSTEKDSIAENSRADGSDLTALINDIEKLIGATVDQNFRLEIKRLLAAGMAQDVVLSAAVRTEDKRLSGARMESPAAYFRRILQSYERDGIWTIADIEVTKPPRRRQNPGGREPTGDPEQWELDWLHEVQARKKTKEGQQDEHV